jgi:hypothetical protein
LLVLLLLLPDVLTKSLMQHNQAVPFASTDPLPAAALLPLLLPSAAAAAAAAGTLLCPSSTRRL